MDDDWKSDMKRLLENLKFWMKHSSICGWVLNLGAREKVVDSQQFEAVMVDHGSGKGGGSECSLLGFGR